VGSWISYQYVQSTNRGRGHFHDKWHFGIIGLAKVAEKGGASGREIGEWNDYFKLKTILYTQQILNYSAKWKKNQTDFYF
jgi:hypothetical protein